MLNYLRAHDRISMNIYGKILVFTKSMIKYDFTVDLGYSTEQ